MGSVLAAVQLTLSVALGATGPHFIENDYPAALAEARARKLPLFAEAWAPW